MAYPKVLTEVEIARILEGEDDDDLDSISVDDEDGDDDGPEEFEEVFSDRPPPTMPPVSPGSQDMFEEELPSPTASLQEPPAKRRRLQSHQKIDSGISSFVRFSVFLLYRCSVFGSSTKTVYG